MDKNEMLIELAKTKDMYEQVFKFLYNTSFNDETDHLIKMELSKNVSVNEDILEKLAKEDSNEIRASVMKHKNATEKMFRGALKDEDLTVRENAILNKNISEAVLIEFLKDESEKIRNLAKKELTAKWN